MVERGDIWGGSRRGKGSERVRSQTTFEQPSRPGPLRRWWALGAAGLIAATTIPSPAGAADPPAFVNGDAKASALLFDLKIQLTGEIGSETGLSLGFGAGRALSQYQDTGASAEGRVADYSLMDLLNMQPSEECPDVVPLYLDSTKPPLTRAESTTPGADVSRLTQVKYAGFPTHGSDFGSQDAVAGPSISATASTNAPSIDSGVIKMLNARSSSTSRVVNGVREAVAVATADSLSILGGAMTLFKPTWTATAKSGSTTVSEATFTYSSAMVLGITRPGGSTGDLIAFKGLIENLFAGLGMKLYLPTATITPGPNGTGKVEISPMIVGLSNIPLGSSLLKPILNALNPRIEESLAAYLAQECSNPAWQLVADVTKGVLGGNGGISFAAGGADAMTDDIYYPPVNLDLPAGNLPLGDTTLISPVDPSVLGTTDTTFPSSLGDISTSSPDLEPTSDTLPPIDEPTDSTTTTTAPTEDGPPRETASVQRTAQRSKPGEKGGTAGWLTVVGLVAVLALAGGDQFVMRRSKRRFTA